MTRSMSSRIIFPGLALSLFAFLLAGCAMGTATYSGPTASDNGKASGIHGTAFGGQQPVVGTTIQLYAAGTAGYGSAATPLLSTLSTPGNQYYAGGATGCVASSAQTCYSNVVTDAYGAFNITGDYTCPAGSYVYIVATGGNPGSTGTNAELAMMAAIGSCSTLAATPFIWINEVTTVAAVTALQQFMSVTNGTVGAFNIGAPSTTYNGVASGMQGMANAFATANVLASVATGTSVKTTSTTAGVPSVTPETDRIYLLANVLAACINTVDGSGSTICSGLFGDVKPDASSTAPSDTIQAMYAIATNPTYNVSTICGVSGSTPPFSGSAACPVNDYTIAVGYDPKYSNAGTIADAIESTYGVAIDAYGNAWLVSEADTAFYAITEVGPTGSLLTGPIQSFKVGTTAHTVNKPRYVAIDQSNNAWVTNSGDATVGGFVAVLPGSAAVNSTTATTSATAIGYTTHASTTSASSAYGIAIDGSNNVFVSNEASSANTLAKFANAGSTYIETATSSIGSGSTGQGIAIDTSTSTAGPFVYVVSGSSCGGNITQFSSNFNSGDSATAVYANAGLTCTPTATSTIAAALGTPVGISIDRNNGIWVADDGAAASYLVTGGTGSIGSTATSSTTITTGATLAATWNVATDGNNNAWMVNSSGNVINVLSATTAGGSPVITPVTGSTGLVHNETNSKLATARDAAIDGSGNVWVTNSTSAGVPYVTVIVGAAGPVVTPVSVALKSGHVGQRP